MTVSKAYLLTEEQRTFALKRLEVLKEHLGAYTDHLSSRTGAMQLYDKNFKALQELLESLPTKPLYAELLERNLDSAPAFEPAWT